MKKRISLYTKNQLSNQKVTTFGTNNFMGKMLILERGFIHCGNVTSANVQTNMYNMQPDKTRCSEWAKLEIVLFQIRI